MTSPSLRRLRQRLARMPLRDRQMVSAYCLIYDASEGACDAYRRLALAGVSVLLDEMRRAEPDPTKARRTTARGRG